MGYYDSFDCQVQCEEVFLPLPELQEQSEDLMDMCEVISLDALKTNGACYSMEEDVIEAIDFDWLWDTKHMSEDLMDRKFRLRRAWN